MTVSLAVVPIVEEGCTHVVEAAETVKPLYGERPGILVSNRATALSFWAMERRQICWGPYPERVPILGGPTRAVCFIA